MINSRHYNAFADHYRGRLGSPVSPAYLAGPGDPRHITHALRAAGWNTDSDPLHPDIRMTSPGLEHSLVISPSPDSFYGWWKVNSVIPGTGSWYASFSGGTPVEIISSVTDALVSPAPDSPPGDVTGILTGRGWTHTTDELGSHRIVSPDSTTLARQRFSPSMGLCGWDVEASPLPEPYRTGSTLWRAVLHADTPGHVLASVAAALSDPTPVPRPRFDTQQSSLLQVGPEVDIGTRIVTAHRERLAQARRHRPVPRPLTASAAPAPASASAGRPSLRR
ncbi:DUF317 domain-containing protein [Streptomyces sp. NPDC093249]|uniref:DUF317 domain-containing protein n=1 Tax=unclassified Streptomyces TaxID=2593676 RepID=UPI00380C0737